MQRDSRPLEQELLDLAAATRDVAATIEDSGIRTRLLEIADELIEGAGQAGRGR